MAIKNIRLLSIIQTTILGGVLFFIPVILLFLVIKHALHLLSPVAEKVIEWVDMTSVLGAATLSVVSVVIILLCSYVSGKLITQGVIRNWSKILEDRLVLLFPTFQMIKFQLLREEDNISDWRAVLIREENWYNVAFITSESDDFISVYLPDAPRIESGEVRIMKKEEGLYIPITYREATQCLTSFGRKLSMDMYLNAEISEKPVE